MRTETEKKPTRESLEISLNAHLETTEHKQIKLDAIEYIQKIWPGIFVMHDADAQQMLGGKKRETQGLRILNTEIFANSCIHLWRWKNDGLVSPAYQLVLVIDREREYYAWQRFNSFNRIGIPFSDDENLPIDNYTLRLDGKPENDVDICEELGIDKNKVVWRNGNKIVCHECSYQAHKEGEDFRHRYYCSTNCSRCHESKDEIRRTCSPYGVCLGNAGNTVIDGSLNMRLVENVEDVIQELENEF